MSGSTKSYLGYDDEAIGQTLTVGSPTINTFYIATYVFFSPSSDTSRSNVATMLPTYKIALYPINDPFF